MANQWLRMSLPRLRASGIACLLSVGLASGAIAETAAEDFEDAVYAFDIEAYPMAEDLLLPLAEGGDPLAQYVLAEVYVREKRGMMPSNPEALKWFRKAAENGVPEAQGFLGFLYEIGYMPGDAADSAMWYRRAAEQGENSAQRALAIIYYEGREGVPRDPVQSYLWLSLAAQGSKAFCDSRPALIRPACAIVSKEQMKSAADFRDKVAKKMTPEQIAEAKKLVAEWKPTQANAAQRAAVAPAGSD